VKGKVKYFDTKKGYGFITNDEGKDVFVHYTGIKSDGFKNLEKDQEVVFDVKNTDRGHQAINVEVIQ
jgi:CspA family cold shock protein